MFTKFKILQKFVFVLLFSSLIKVRNPVDTHVIWHVYNTYIVKCDTFDLLAANSPAFVVQYHVCVFLDEVIIINSGMLSSVDFPRMKLHIWSGVQLWFNKKENKWQNTTMRGNISRVSKPGFICFNRWNVCLKKKSTFRLPFIVCTDHLYDMNMIERLRDIAQSLEYNVDFDWKQDIICLNKHIMAKLEDSISRV